MELCTWLLTQKSHCPQSCPYSVHVRKHTLNRRTCKIYLSVNKEKWVLFWESIQRTFTWETRHGHEYIVCLPRDWLWVQTTVKPWNNLDLQRTRIGIYNAFNVGVNLLKEGPCLLQLIPSSQKRQQSLRVCLSRDYIYQTEFPEWWFEAHTLFSSSSSFFSPSSFLLPSPLPGGEGPVTELFKTAPPLPKKSPLLLPQVLFAITESCL